jgi:hypothetical protein
VGVRARRDAHQRAARVPRRRRAGAGGHRRDLPRAGTAPEGRLAKIRAAAVKTGSLADVAREVGLGDYVRLGKGEAASGGADKDSILADTLEAVIGAAYLDGGYEVAYELVRLAVRRPARRVLGRGAALDYKTSLQELPPPELETVPQYEVDDEGPDHQKVFTAVVRVAASASSAAARGASRRRPSSGRHGWPTSCWPPRPADADLPHGVTQRRDDGALTAD